MAATKATLNIRLVMAGDFVVKADWVLGPRRIPDYELVYFPFGTKTSYEANGCRYRLSEPCLVMTRPDEEHTYHFDPDHTTRHLFFHFIDETGDAAPGGGLALLSANGPAMIPLQGNSVVPALLRQAMSVTALKESNWRLRSALLLGAALGEIEALAAAENKLRPHALWPQQISLALDFMNANISRPSLTVAEIADVTGWSHEHFSRIFARHFGMPPRDAIMVRRIELACKLLVQESWSVKVTAHAVGLEDEHYFSRLFHKLKGVTPSQYRTKYANPRNRHLAPADDALSAYPLNEYFDYT